MLHLSVLSFVLCSAMAQALQVTERSEKDLPHLQVDWRKLAQHAYFSKTQGVDENALGKVVLWHALAAEIMWLTFMRRSEAFNEEHREFYKLEMQFCESYIAIIAHAIVSGRPMDERIHERLAFVNGMLLTAS
jgi:hypothetical protein